jgi:hypothetical protein
MVPISEAIFEPILPARISATTDDENSRRIESLTVRLMMYFGKIGFVIFIAV